MYVLMLNGSPHTNGVGATALNEMQKVFNNNDIQTEIINVGGKNVRGCIACRRCESIGKCIFDDIVNELSPKFEKADGLVVSSPVYYASANATIIALLDRLFYSTPFDKTMKVGTAIATARRGGITATFDELNKFFAISGMPIATGQYWNGLHGQNSDDAQQDLEGLQMMRTLAENMSFLIKSIQLGKEKFNIPQREEFIRTNFIR